jgi:hypothetical protein
MDINTLRSMRSKTFSKISQEMENLTKNNSYTDDRFWKLEADKAGNATAVIRFLPGLDENALPWVRLFNHGFKGPTGRWYIENSLTSIGEDDPVSELNARLWNSGKESDKDIARKQKRRLYYISNILIISDPKHPENEGEVKLFKYGKKIFEMLKDKASPTFEDDTPVNVFDPFEGANFKLRMRMVDGYPSFDLSTFMEPTPIRDTDEKMLEILNKQYELSEFSSKKNFKSYDELAKKLNQVLNPNGGNQSIAEDDMNTDIEFGEKRKIVTPPMTNTAFQEEDDEDAMDFFKKIALED